jgi:hypothetical protein
MHFPAVADFFKKFYLLAPQRLTNSSHPHKIGFFARNLQVRAWVEGRLIESPKKPDSKGRKIRKEGRTKNAADHKAALIARTRLTAGTKETKQSQSSHRPLRSAFMDHMPRFHPPRRPKSPPALACRPEPTTCHPEP